MCGFNEHLLSEAHTLPSNCSISQLLTLLRITRATICQKANSRVHRIYCWSPVHHSSALCSDIVLFSCPELPPRQQHRDLLSLLSTFLSLYVSVGRLLEHGLLVEHAPVLPEQHVRLPTALLFLCVRLVSTCYRCVRSHFGCALYTPHTVSLKRCRLNKVSYFLYIVSANVHSHKSSMLPNALTHLKFPNIDSTKFNIEKHKSVRNCQGAKKTVINFKFMLWKNWPNCDGKASICESGLWGPTAH